MIISGVKVSQQFQLQALTQQSYIITPHRPPIPHLVPTRFIYSILVDSICK